MRRVMFLLGMLMLAGCATDLSDNKVTASESAETANILPDVELVSEKSVNGYLACIRQGLGSNIQESPLNKGTRISGGQPAFNIDVYQAIESIYVKADIPANLQGFNPKSVEQLVYRCK